MVIGGDIERIGELALGSVSAAGRAFIVEESEPGIDIDLPAIHNLVYDRLCLCEEALFTKSDAQVPRFGDLGAPGARTGKRDL